MMLTTRGHAAIAACKLALARRRLADEADQPTKVDPSYRCCRHCYSDGAGACPMADRHTIPCDKCQ